MGQNQGPGPDPSQVDGAAADPSGHTTLFWNDNGVANRISADVDRQGKVTGEHYVQKEGDTKLTYDYDTGTWKDKSE